jgi:hypothetical protein
MTSRAGRWLRAASLAVASLAVSLLSPRPAPASVLSLCDGPTVESGAHALIYRAVDGSSRTLRLDEKAPLESCASLALPLASSDVLTLALMPPAGDHAPEALALQGSNDAQGRFVIGQIEARTGAAPAVLPILTLGRDLLSTWTPRAFGAEERASVTQAAGEITLACRAGEQPAGFFIAEGAALPAIPGLEIEIAARGDDGFVFAAADESTHRRDAPLPLMTLTRAAATRSARAKLPASLDRQSPVTWSVLCPRNAGTLTLARAALAPALEATRIAAPVRSAWAWQPQLWQETPASLLDRLRAQHIDRVYITVPLDDDASVATPAKLAAFVEAAARQGLGVWAVDGDPHAVLPSEREKFRTRSAALAAYNRRHPTTGRLAGVQYDIEPYLVPGFALDPDRWTAAYLDTLAMLGAAAEMPVEAALPFWFRFEKWGEKLADAVESIALMDYRTDAAEIERSALPALVWGTTYRRAVHIGLELGPLGDEERRRFRCAESGELWRVALGDQHALLLLLAPQKNPLGESYALTSQNRMPGSGVTFNGRESLVDTVLPPLVAAFEAWPAYAGIALHGLF